MSWGAMPGKKFVGTSIDPLAFVERFDTGLPHRTLKWTGGFLMAPSRNHKKGSGAGDIGAYVDQACSEMDVIAQLCRWLRR